MGCSHRLFAALTQGLSDVRKEASKANMIYHLAGQKLMLLLKHLFVSSENQVRPYNNYTRKNTGVNN
jgi:hypothetical protein